MTDGSRRLPFRRLLPLILVMVLGVSHGVPGDAAGTVRESATPVPSAPPLIDLAWLLPLPSDLPDSGYQLFGGYDISPVSYGPEPRSVWGQAFAAATALSTWQQAYETILSHPSTGDPQVADRRINVRLSQYVDASSAAAGLAVVRRVDEQHGYGAISTPFAVGADGVLLRGRSVDPYDRPSVSLLGLTRLENLVVEVNVQDYAGVAPNASLPAALMTGITSQLPAALAGQTPNMSHRVARLAPPDGRETRGMTEVDRYLRRDDIQLPDPWPQQSDSFHAMETFAQDHLIQNWYRYDATRMRPGLSLTCIMDVFQFPDAAAATAYVSRTDGEMEAQIAQDNSDADDIQVVLPPADIGTDAILGIFGVDHASGESYGAEGWVRFEDAVTRVICNGLPGRSETTMWHLLAAAAVCLETTCTEPRRAARRQLPTRQGRSRCRLPGRPSDAPHAARHGDRMPSDSPRGESPATAPDQERAAPAAPRRGGLGRGLGALIPTFAEDAPAATHEIDIDAIAPNPYQPRVELDAGALEDLAASIRLHGVIQPLLLTHGAERGRYILVAGERRWRAARLAGLGAVPAVVREAAPRAMLEMALVENVVRADLSPLEEAAAYRQLIDDFGLTQAAVAERVGRSRVSVTNTLRLLALPDRVQRALGAGEISEGHARALLGLPSAAEQAVALDWLLERGLSVRQTEELVRRWAAGEPPQGARRSVAPPTLASEREAIVRQAFIDRLQRAIGTRVGFRPAKAGGGTLTIHFGSDEELNAFYEKLGGQELW